jgi:hypothetical protein
MLKGNITIEVKYRAKPSEKIRTIRAEVPVHESMRKETDPARCETHLRTLGQQALAEIRRQMEGQTDV